MLWTVRMVAGSTEESTLPMNSSSDFILMLEIGGMAWELAGVESQAELAGVFYALRLSIRKLLNSGVARRRWCE